MQHAKFISQVVAKTMKELVNPRRNLGNEQEEVQGIVGKRIQKFEKRNKETNVFRLKDPKRKQKTVKPGCFSGKESKKNGKFDERLQENVKKPRVLRRGADETQISKEVISNEKEVLIKILNNLNDIISLF